MEGNNQLIIAGSLSFIAAIMHITIIFGGPEWYRFFGAGESMAQLASTGSYRPALITLCISLILAIWGCYAFSGAGIIPPFPFLKLGLILITAIYLLRGIAGLILPFISNHPAISQNSPTFWLVSSFICCIFGTAHLLGTINNWKNL